MNKHLYRIVFNQHRGQLMVVAEHAASNGKDGAQQDDASQQIFSLLPLLATLRPLTLAMLASLGMLFALPASAQIVADRNAPASQRPTVLVTANGLPQVNIQTPSAAGVSRNTYTQFDVQQPGVVLNNSRTDVTSQLGGWVQGNPWLATGSARVILNEVNSSNPSQWNGYVEVAGQRAEVIIANPTGINVDGGGFINVSRATLTTGTAILNNGALAGFMVRGGAVTVNGLGLDASTTDYTGILARAAQINAGVWAKQLNVVTGANQIDADQSTISAITPTGAAPAFALDVALLGGMYANKIFLTGTEAGIGVRNAGNIGAAAGQVIVTSAGRLENSGSIAATVATTATATTTASTSNATATLQVAAQGGIDNTGSLSSTADMSLVSGADLSNGGTVFAATSLLLTSPANIGNSGTLHGATSTTLTAATMRNSGLIESEAQTVLTLQADADNTAGTILGQRIALSSANGAINNQNGKIVQSGSIGFDISALGLSNGHGGQVGVAPVAATSASSSDSAATTTAATSSTSTNVSTGTANTTSTTTTTPAVKPTPVVLPNGVLRAATVLNNDGGLVSAGGAITLAVANLDNTGGQLNLDSLTVNGAAFSNQGGKLSVVKAFNVHAATFDNQRGSVLVGTQFYGQLGQFDNTGGLLQAALLHLDVANALDNSGGVLRQSGTSATQISVGAAFNNLQGSIETAGNLNLTAASMSGGGGTLTALGDVHFDAGAGAVNAHGATWAAGGNVTVRSAAFDNSGGSISAGRDLTINSAGLNNHAGSLSALANNVIVADGALDNSSGTIQAGATLQLTVSAALGNQAGAIETLNAGSHLVLQAASIDNTLGNIVDVGVAGTHISSDGSVHNSGVITSNGALTLLATSLSNLTGGKLVAGNHLELGVTQALVNSGAISSGASLNFDQSGARFANSGQIIAGTSASISAASIDNDGGVMATAKASGGDLLLTAGVISNQGGAMVANHSLVVTANGALGNSNGTLHAAQDLQLAVLGALGNNGGVIEAVGASSMMQVATGSINNGNGHILNLGNGATSVASQGAILSSGMIAGNGDLTLTATTLTNSGTISGAIEAGKALDLLVSQHLNNLGGGAISSGGVLNFQQAGAAFNNSGQIVAGADITLVVGAANNDGGSISTVKQSQGSIALSSQSLSNQGGSLLADKNATLHVVGDINNSQGVLQAGQDLSATAGGKLANNGGSIEAIGSGIGNSSSALALQAQSIDNNSGRITNLGAGAMLLSSASTVLNGGAIAGNGDLTLQAQSLQNNLGATISTGGNLELGLTQQLMNQGAINSAGTLNFNQAKANFSNSGNIIASGAISIVANHLNNDGGRLGTALGSKADLSITSQGMSNAGGHIVTDRDLTLVTHLMPSLGELSAGRDLLLSMDGDYTQTASAQVHAQRDLSLSITGNFSNAATLAALRTLNLSASQITNQAGATLQGDGVTLHAVGAVSNAGAINATLALAITAASVDNSNSIVGGNLTITAQAISNSGAQALLGATSSTGTLALWVGSHLTNSNGATIYSAGDMAIAADSTRDANGLLLNRTTLIDNTSASMEAAGNLEMVAGTVNNTRSGVTIEHIKTIDTTTVMTMPSWWKMGNNYKYYDPNSSLFSAKEIYYLNPADILSTSTIYTPDGLALTRAVIKTHANDTVFFNAWSGRNGDYGHRDRIVQTDGTQIVYYHDRTDGLSNPDQVAGASGVWYGDQRPGRQWDTVTEPFSNQYGSSCSTNCVRLVAQYQYTDPLTTIDRDTQHLIAPFLEFLEVERDAHHVAVEDRVAADSGVAAAIRSGGNLRLAVDQGLNNQYSNIVASGALTIDGGANAAIVNQAMTLYRTHTFDGVWMDSNGDRTAYTMPNISEAIGSLTGVISGGQGVLITGRSFANIDVTAGAVGNIRTAVDVIGSGASGGALSGAAAASGTQNNAATSSAVAASGMQNNAVGGQPGSAGVSVTKAAPAIKSAALAARGAASVINVAPTGLAKLNPNPDSQYLFETRSEFTNHGNWISSDYLFTALNLNPDTTQKRLGDGFYEQRLVREQLSELTGRAPAGGVSDDSAYKNLLDSGISYAKQWDLRPGIALTATQIAHLTSDIVWLESDTVTLPDGSTQVVLAPKVYLAHLTTGSVTSAGALVTGNNVTINVGDINNRGGLIDGGAGRTLLIATQDITNSSGNIKGATVALQAGRDIVNQTLSVTQTYASAKNSGNDKGNYTVLANQAGISATGALTLSAGRDLNNIGASLNAGGAAQIMAGRNINFTSVQTGSEHTSLMQAYSANDSSVGHQTSAINVGGDLTMAASEDIKLSGAQLAIKGNGVLAAGRDMVVSAVIDDVKSDHHNDVNAQRYDKRIIDDERVVGASIKADGNLTFKAGAAGGSQTGALSLLGSTVTATGDVSLAASGNVTIASVTEHHLLDAAAHDSSSSFLSKRTSSSIDYSASSLAVGSNVEGKTIAISSGNDIAVKGSTIVADNNIDISAARDISIVSAQNTQTSNHASSSTSSGLMSGSMGFAIGKVTSNNTGASSSVTQVGSQVASLGGNVKMTAGGAYTQTASQIAALAPATASTAAGDVSIVASKVNITSANDSSTSQNHADYSKTALGVSVDIPIVDAVKSIGALAQAAGKTKDERMQALAAATLVSKTVDLAKAAATPDVGIKVSFSLSNSKTASDAQETSSTAVGSTVNAAGNVSIIATGASATSTLDIVGSTISAGNNATVLADGKITLSAATNTSTQTSSNSGSGWNAGVGYTFGPSAGTTFDFGANKANGTVSGQDTSAVNTYIKAGNTATVNSGGDTSIMGAVISGNTVNVNVGGKLNIASVQDSSTYASSNHSASFGASLCIPPFCAGKSSVSGSLAQGKVNGAYASVIEQSGIKAGDGGFNVDVAGNTDLNGAAIASSQAAIISGANHFKTATLSTSDLENTDHYNASGFGISGSVSGKAGDQTTASNAADRDAAATKSTPSGAAGFGGASGNQSSTTKTGISGGAIDITDASAQQALTGKSAAATLASVNQAVSTDVDSSGALKKAWNGAALGQEVQAQVLITTAFGQTAAKSIGDYADKKREEAKSSGDLVEAAKWDEGGVYRVAAHTVVGALTGGVNGALGAGATAKVTPAIAEQIAKLDVSDGLKDALTMAAGAAVGGAVGGQAGAATGANEVTNNYLKHAREAFRIPSEQARFDAAVTKCNGGDSGACSTRDQLTTLSQARDQGITSVCAGGPSADCHALVSLAQNAGNDVLFDKKGNAVVTEKGLSTLIALPAVGEGTFHDVLAKSTLDGLLMEAGGAATNAVLGTAGKVIGAIKNWIANDVVSGINSISVLESDMALPMGSRYNQMNQPKNPTYQSVRNEAGTVDETNYSGHAFDRMQDRGIMPSVVNDAIINGIAIPGKGGTTTFISLTNNVSVVTNNQGKIITVMHGGK